MRAHRKSATQKLPPKGGTPERSVWVVVEWVPDQLDIARTHGFANQIEIGRAHV